MHHLEDIEVGLLIKAISDVYDYDLSNYSFAFIKRRLVEYMRSKNIKTISALIPLIIHNKDIYYEVYNSLSIPVTQMFRNPSFYKAFKQYALPILKTFAFLKIWIIGCATGEEAYSLAIFLKEADIYERCLIYATDKSEPAIRACEAGIYPLKKMKQYTENYQEACGIKSFSDYYHARYENAIIDSSLKENIVFSVHNLVTDWSIGEMNLILCRNVIIYFSHPQRRRCFLLLNESLCNNGILCFGKKEMIQHVDDIITLKPLCQTENIYQKKLILKKSGRSNESRYT